MQVVPDWVLQVRELNEQIRASEGQTRALAEQKRDIIRAAQAAHTRAEIARLLGITQSRVDQMVMARRPS